MSLASVLRSQVSKVVRKFGRSATLHCYGGTVPVYDAATGKGTRSPVDVSVMCSVGTSSPSQAHEGTSATFAERRKLTIPASYFETGAVLQTDDEVTLGSDQARWSVIDVDPLEVQGVVVAYEARVGR